MTDLSDKKLSWVLLALGNDYAYTHLHILERSAMLLEISTWDLGTKFNFSLHSEHVVGVQIASKPFDVRGEEGAGSCFLEEYGTPGSIKEETMAKEMAVLCTHFVSVNNVFQELGPQSGFVTGPDPVLTIALETTHNNPIFQIEF